MTAIAIFVKTPGLSPLKTRLANGIGRTRAIDLYRQCAASVLAVARSADVGPVYWALAESTAEAIRHWPEDAEIIQQGSGNLGQRMGRVMKTLVDRHGSGLLLGADAPQLEVRQLRRAAQWLQDLTPSNVIGPARDGGFWTFGSNHTTPISQWTRVVYSRPDTLERFTQSMNGEAQWLELPILTDLDTAADLNSVAAELHKLRRRLPEQENLMRALWQMRPHSYSAPCPPTTEPCTKADNEE